MCTEKKTIEIKQLQNYFKDQILMAESGIAFWNRRAGRGEQAAMLKYWKTVKEVHIKSSNDLLGNASIIPEIATIAKKQRSIVVPNELKEGTPEHLKYYEDEYDRVKKLADKATGDLANELFLELDNIAIILESYLP